MKKSLLVLSVILVMGMLSINAPTVLFAQANDPASVYKALVTAMNAKQMDAAAALFSPTGMVDSGAELYNGKDEIVLWLAAQAAQNFHDDSGTPQVSGNSLIVRDNITTTTFTTLGVAPIVYDIQVVVDNGKIMTYVAHPTGASGRALAAAVAKIKPEVDAISLINELQKAVNAGDAKAAAALFAPDATIIRSPTFGTNNFTETGIYNGTTAIQAYYVKQISQHLKVNSTVHILIGQGVALSVSTLDYQASPTAATIPLTVYSYTIVRGGKIEQQIITVNGAGAAAGAAATPATSS